jgi:hydrogenase maturation factor HypF (carbamoyltransferase family)
MDIASRYSYRHVACSGGVFQNKLLVDLLIQDCPADRTLHFHRELPPNDENLAFGQLAYLYAVTMVGGMTVPEPDKDMPPTDRTD